MLGGMFGAHGGAARVDVAPIKAELQAALREHFDVYWRLLNTFLRGQLSKREFDNYIKQQLPGKGAVARRCVSFFFSSRPFVQCVCTTRSFWPSYRKCSPTRRRPKCFCSHALVARAVTAKTKAAVRGCCWRRRPAHP